MRALATRIVRLGIVMAWGLAALPALAQQDVPSRELDATDRPISEVRIVGLERVPRQRVLHELRVEVDQPFDPEIVKQDVARLHRLGDFSHIDARFELRADGTVAVIYVLDEAPIIAEISVVGNKVINDQDLLAVTRIRRGMPRDDYLIDAAAQSIEELYRQRGHYLTTVTVDESELEESGILFFRVVEGPRVKIRAIVFEGNAAFTDGQLRAEIETKTAVPIIRRGELDRDRLVDDVAALDRFYRNRGYIDVRVDKTLELSPDSTEAKVTYVIVEGPSYVLRSIETDPDPLSVFSKEQIVALMSIKPGDVYAADRIRESRQAIRNAYLYMGYADLLEDQRIELIPLHSSDKPEVALLIRIDEGRPYKVGLVHVTGNFLTKDKVIRRHLRQLKPGRPLDGRVFERARDQLRATRLFNDVRISVQDPDPDDPEYRDVIVEVKEANTGAVNFGIAAGSDAGFFGEFSVTQRNFDITDFPTSLGELFSGRAFRGGGQRFAMTLRPGNELFQYSMSWTEPYLLDTPYSLSVAGSYAERTFNSAGRDIYDETRLTVPITIGRELGEIWNAGLTAKFENVELEEIDPMAPAEFFRDAGPTDLNSIGLRLTRSTVRSFQRPGEGSRLELQLEQFGALGGDVTFSRIEADYTVFLTLHRDFLGRRQILKLSGRVGYIFSGTAPVYETFYLGGRTLRGFEFRTVSPKGLTLSGQPTNDPIGGDWLVFLGAQYEIPLIEENLNFVVFMDSGTVTEDPGFEDYRLSIGAGLRIYIPQFGPVPLAFDFATPLLKEDDDEEQVFSFSAELPF